MAQRRPSRIQSGWAKNPGRSRPLFRPAVPSAAPRLSYVPNTFNPESIKPDDIVIRDPGEHILSNGPSGISKIQFYPKLFSTEDSDRIFSTLLEDLPWKQNSDKHGLQPRLTVWYGDHPYSYSGLSHPPNLKWPSLLTEIREKLQTVTGRDFNSLLCNLYRDHKDSVDWHSDDEPALRRHPCIASVTFGEVRPFELRKKPPPERFGDYSVSQEVKMHLPHGSLLVMEGATQEDWHHRLPKEYHDRGPRINLTYRTIYPE